MTEFKCKMCGKKLEGAFLVHIKVRHPDAYEDALDELIREFFGDEAVVL